MGLIDAPNAPEKPQGKAVQMTTVIPPVEEPLFSIMVVACKPTVPHGGLGNIYVGHAQGQEFAAHMLCLKGADTLYRVLINRLAEHERSGIVVPPPGMTIPTRRDA